MLVSIFVKMNFHNLLVSSQTCDFKKIDVPLKKKGKQTYILQTKNVT